jgi:hypothetical protein
MPKPSSSRQKGRAFEKKICAIFQECFNLDDDHARCAPASVQGVDIIFSMPARKLVGLSVECKNVRSLNIWKALEQAKKNTLPGTEPAVVFHRSVSGNRETWIAVPLDHYMDLRRSLINPRVVADADE